MQVNKIIVGNDCVVILSGGGVATNLSIVAVLDISVIGQILYAQASTDMDRIAIDNIVFADIILQPIRPARIDMDGVLADLILH